MKRLEISPGLAAVPVAAVHADALATFIQRNRLHLWPYLPAVAEIDSPESARSHLITVVDRVGRGELWEWHLFADEVLCGAVRLNGVEPHNRKVAVAYYLGADYQGRGIATMAVRSVLEYAFGTLGLHRVELRCAVGNVSSIRVAQRLGFVREGELRAAEWLEGRFVNLYVFGLLRSEFQPSGQPLGHHVIPTTDIGPTDDLSERYRRLHRWGKEHENVGGFPAFIEEEQNGRPSYGIALIEPGMS